MISEKALKAVMSLAKTGSFQESARDLGVSNASLSRHVQQAESEVGFVLFRRGNTGCDLTPEGRAFMPLARRLDDDMARFATRVSELRSSEQEHLRIGCGPLATRSLLTPVIRAFREKMPGTRLSVQVQALAEPIRLLDRGEVDIFVGDLSHTSGVEGLDIHVVRRREVRFVTRPGHPLQTGKPNRLEDLFRYPFLSPYMPRFWRARLTAAMGGGEEAEWAVERLPSVECDDYALLCDLIDGSDAVLAGMPEHFRDLEAAGLARPLPIDTPLFWNICLSRRKETQSAAAQLFWELLQAQGKVRQALAEVDEA